MKINKEYRRKLEKSILPRIQYWEGEYYKGKISQDILNSRIENLYRKQFSWEHKKFIKERIKNKRDNLISKGLYIFAACLMAGNFLFLGNEFVKRGNFYNSKPVKELKKEKKKKIDSLDFIYDSKKNLLESQIDSLYDKRRNLWKEESEDKEKVRKEYRTKLNKLERNLE